ncbi:glycoside hydrolase family 3 protein [Kitasatospora azatica]|uniref:glycoside hydrolase family 3 protein n=1 Tax=Kitasatospora azatica TaxID=58347 RepID=UPI0006916DE8|nr:glycoside hydrolase family 3 protein [Kitasatospora azatica]
MQSIDSIVDSLLSRLSVDEKVGLLHQYAPAVPRLGMASFRTGTEVVHGVGFCGVATAFPQAVGLAASWDPELMRRVGDLVGSEVRALHERDPSIGLNVWGPVVNLLRDPRWGRNEEGYSEDPTLTTALAVAYCQGLRGDHPTLLRVTPTLKSFLAYNHETDKFDQDSQVRPRVFHEYDSRPFVDSVRAGVVSGVMPSYGLVNGRPNHVGEHLRALCEEFPDLVVVSDAFAPSDLVEKTGYFAEREVAATSLIRTGLASFTDHSADPGPTRDTIRRALDRGLLVESDLDGPVRRMLRMRALTGEFLQPGEDPYAGREVEVGTGAPQRELAREAAARAIVLLRNERGTLPLDPGRPITLAVVGPFADRVCSDWYGPEPPYEVTPLAGLRERFAGSSVRHVEGVDRVAFRLAGTDLHVTAVAEDGGGALWLEPGEVDGNGLFDVFDWGEGGLSFRAVANRRFLTCSRTGELVNDKERPWGWVIRETFRLVPSGDGHLLYNTAVRKYAAVVPGSRTLVVAEDPASAAVFVVDQVSDGVAEAARAARDADAVVVLVGTYPQINGHEMCDRTELELAPRQTALVQAVAEADPSAVVAVVSGHPVTMEGVDEQLSAVIWSAHGGQEFGTALAEVVAGDRAPTGRLPQTWYRSVDQLPSLFDYDIIKCGGTYLYLRETPLYPFGHGLSYTSFEYSDLGTDTDTVSGEQGFTVRVTVANTGGAEGEEVVQLYLRAPDGPVPRPLRQLLAFRRVSLAAGETATVEIPVDASQLAYWDVAGRRWRVAPGSHEIMAGSSSGDIRLSTKVDVRADAAPPRALGPALVRAADFDDYRGVRLVPEHTMSGDAVAADGAGSWLLFRDVDLSGAPDTFVARVAGVTAAACRLEVRLDDQEHGRILASVQVASDPESGGWATVRASCDPLHRMEAVHDVYLRFTGPAKVSAFALYRLG